MEEFDKNMVIAVAKHLIKSRKDNMRAEYPVGIAKYGEKVISLVHNQGYSIRRGETFTVNRFHLDAYNFKECPAEYDPYLGEDAARWFDEKYFMPVNQQSKEIIRLTNNLEDALEQKISVLRKNISEHVASESFNKKPHKEDFHAYLDNLISWLHQYDNEFKEYLSITILENCGQFEIESNGYALNEALQQCHFFKCRMEKMLKKKINELYPATYKTWLAKIKFKSTQYFKIQNFIKEYPTYVNAEIKEAFVYLNIGEEISNMFALQLKSAAKRMQQ